MAMVMQQDNSKRKDSTPRMPADLQTEQAILGAVLLDGSVIDQMIAELDPSDFSAASNRLIYIAMVALARKQVVIDPITLQSQMRDDGTLDKIGGGAYLASLMDGGIRTRNVDHYINILKDKGVNRKLMLLLPVIEDLVTEPLLPEEKLAKIENYLQDIQPKSKKDFVNLVDVVRERAEYLEKLQNENRDVLGIPTGFTELDMLTQGFQPGQLVVIGARPGVGKSAFAINVGLYAAEKGFKVGLFSLEMADFEVADRALSSDAMMNLHFLKTRFINREQWGKISSTLERFAGMKFFIDDSPNITVHRMRTKAKRIKYEQGLDLLFVDYLQLIKGTRKNQRQQEVGEISTSLKQLARELGIPIVALCQLSRSCEERTDHRPILSDLRESGNIEQDSDLVLMIYREEMYSASDENKGIAEVLIRKQRNGPTGEVRLAWIKELTKFASLWDEKKVREDEQRKFF